MKVLYIDTETTGTDHRTHDVIQVAGLIEIDGQVRDEFMFRCQPFDFAAVDPKALEVNGTTKEALATYPEPDIAYSAMTAIWAKYVSKFNRADKFTPAGYNVGFDLDFLASFFVKNGDNYFGSWQNWRAIDPLAMVRILQHKGLIDLPDHRLGTLCAHFGIPLKAHDALADIRATRELLLLLEREYLAEASTVVSGFAKVPA
ncbi:MAG: 3'-5' exonuclease [Patescibacteria group bacterium]|nr:3'-5' exonuclease [Patescibacteria group bacterium]